MVAHSSVFVVIEGCFCRLGLYWKEPVQSHTVRTGIDETGALNLSSCDLQL